MSKANLACNSGLFHLDRGFQVAYCPQAMWKPIQLFPLPFLALLLCLLAGSCSADTQTIASEPLDGSPAIEGILVLRNGNVLRGNIDRRENFYRVTTEKSELQVRAVQVEMFCHSLDEAYQRRREMRTGLSSDSHIELARWCLRHNLLKHASRELQDVRTTDPHHRQLALLERQLKLTLSNVKHSKKPSASNQTPPPAALEINLLAAAPHTTRAAFARQIQPLLISSCATSGCHQTNSSEQYQLNRLATDGAGHPDLMLQNLAATLAQIDRQFPQNSTLLEHAKRAHGTTPKKMAKPLPAHRVHLLAAWIEQFSVKPSETQPGTKVGHAAREDPFDPEAFNRLVAARNSSPEPAIGSRDLHLPARPAEAE